VARLASFGLLSCLNFGPWSLFLCLFLSWVLSFYKGWWGFIKDHPKTKKEKKKKRKRKKSKIGKSIN
jgi:hypothetical protein